MVNGRYFSLFTNKNPDVCFSVNYSNGKSITIHSSLRGKLKPFTRGLNVLYNQEDWPNWWKGVITVQPLQNGDVNNIGKRCAIAGKVFCHTL